MAENCQYCGGRLKKLHPAHEVFCTERPRPMTDAPVVAGMLDLYLSGQVSAASEMPVSKPPVSKSPANMSVVSNAPVSNPKTDRKAYMRDLMRKKRAAAKGPAS